MQNTRLLCKTIIGGGCLCLASTFAFSLEGQSHFLLVKDSINPALTFQNTPARYKGASWIDLDDDNRPDLYVCQRFLFRNEGKGNFTRLPDISTTLGAQGAAGGAWGDIDNDGDPDVLIAARFSGLYRNDQVAGFANITAVLPGMEDYPAWDCTLVDADNNGRLDPLFVHANGFHGNLSYPCKFFLQGIDGQFLPQQGWTFTDSLAPFTIPTWCDYDLDGDQDLFIGSGPGGRPGFDHCFQNTLKETGTFGLKRLKNYPFDQPQDGQVYSFPDLDNDGDLDLCLTNYAGAVSGLWRNDKGVYRMMSAPFSRRRSYLSNNWADLDNDGDLDVLITRDSANYVHVYWNDGLGNFSATETSNTPGNGLSGLAIADYDNDGDLDFYVNGASDARSLFQNDLEPGQERHWVQLKLTGTRSNRSALGAVIRLKADATGRGAKWQTRSVLAHTSFQGQNDLRVHFGLGLATQIDSLEVRWPSGQVDVFIKLTVDQFFKLEEGTMLQIVPEQTTELKASATASALRFNLKDGAKIKSLSLANDKGQVFLARFQQQGTKFRLDLPVKLPLGRYYLNLWTENGKVIHGSFRLDR